MNAIPAALDRTARVGRARQRLAYHGLVAVVFLPCLIATAFQRRVAGAGAADRSDFAAVLNRARSHAHATAGYAFQP